MSLDGATDTPLRHKSDQVKENDEKPFLWVETFKYLQIILDQNCKMLSTANQSLFIVPNKSYGTNSFVLNI